MCVSSVSFPVQHFCHCSLSTKQHRTGNTGTIHVKVLHSVVSLCVVCKVGTRHKGAIECRQFRTWQINQQGSSVPGGC